MKHVTSFEESKKLKEAGFEIPTRYSYGSDGKLALTETLIYEGKDYYPTYLATELLDEMPSPIGSKSVILIIEKTYDSGYYVAYNEDDGEWYHYEKADTLPNALSKMIRWLKKNNYMEE